MAEQGIALLGAEDSVQAACAWAIEIRNRLVAFTISFF